MKFVLASLVGAAAAGPPAGFEEAWRSSALKFANAIHPQMSDANLQQLQAGLAAKDPSPPLALRQPSPSTHPSVSRAVDQLCFYVTPAPSDCSDAGPGSESEPLCTVAKGVAKCRGNHGHGAASTACALLLREGTHRLRQTVVLGPEDSGLVISGYPGEHAIVSGAVPVAASAWTKVRSLTSSLELWRTKVQHRPASIDTLLVDGVRAIPARYPNADGEFDKFPIGYVTKGGSWTTPAPLGEPSYIEYNSSDTYRDSYRTLFKDYRGGVGGQCSHYDPPFSYWCAEKPEGGGASQYTVPSGLSFDAATLPNAPYANASGARVTAWRPGHWANWQFEVNGSSAEGTMTKLSFGKGGFQGGRGNSRGAEWFVSHLPEELDFPREYWYNTTDASLYFVSGTAPIDCQGDPNCWPERSQPAPSASVFEHAQLHSLFELRGSQQRPVADVTFSSLTFTGTATTFLDPHGVPSGGDWALQRSAAIFIQGTVNTTLEACDLIRLDGNAVMLSSFNRQANLSHNTFLSTGASAISLWGDSNGSHPLQPTGTGPDGTEGNFPRGSHIHANFFRHLGVHEKQSSCLFQAKSAETTFSNNICFDVPRAGININDGFGGGNDIARNLVFQTCGESGDHGAINTWDRQSYITTIRNGTPSVVPATTAIHHNWIVADYDADGGMVDNDDGSSFYEIYANFGIYGGAKMGNYDGHGKACHGNVYAFPNVYGKSCFWNWAGWFPLDGYLEQFFNNTCIMDGAHQNYIQMPDTAHTGCVFAKPPSVGVRASANKVYAPGADAVVTGCDGQISFKQWMALGLDKGSTISELPSNDEVIAMGMAVLGLA